MKRGLKHSPLVITILLTLSLAALSFFNFLLFHTLAELFSILIASTAFIFLVSTYPYHNNHFLTRLVVAFVYIIILDILHTLAYKGMPIFPRYDADLPTQLWIAARYLQSVSILIACFRFDRSLNIKKTLLIYALVTAVLLVLIFTRVFPSCYIEGVGLTPFKKISEYVICLILFVAFYRLYQKRASLDSHIFFQISLFLVFTILSEIVFTTYFGVYGVSNMIGHISKIIASYCLYAAVLQVGLRNPFDLMYQEVKTAQQTLLLERENLAKQVEEQTQELREKNLALEKAMATQKEFFAIVNHELRTPLTAIIGYSDMQLAHHAEPSIDKWKQQSKAINQNGRHLLAIINDILDISKMNAGKLDLYPSPTSLTEIAESCLLSISPQCEEKNIQFQVINHGVDGYYPLDGKRIRQIIINLLSNAVKFTPSGGQVVLEMDQDADARMIILQVWDSGIGIAEDQLAYLFTPFFQANSDVYQNETGSGLGLTIVKHLVEIMGGKISIKSQINTGTRFTIHLPY